MYLLVLKFKIQERMAIEADKYTNGDRESASAVGIGSLPMRHADDPVKPCGFTKDAGRFQSKQYKVNRSGVGMSKLWISCG